MMRRCVTRRRVGWLLLAGMLGGGLGSAGLTGCGGSDSPLLCFMRLLGSWYGIPGARQADGTFMSFSQEPAGEGEPVSNQMGFTYSPPGSGSFLGQVTWEQTTNANNRGELVITDGPEAPSGVIAVGATLTVTTRFSSDGNTLTTVMTGASGSQTQTWGRVID